LNFDARLQKLYKGSDAVEFDLNGAAEFDYRRINDDFSDDFYERKECLHRKEDDTNTKKK
jgi:hypothetical protein